jgi:hypothetical protein
VEFRSDPAKEVGVKDELEFFRWRKGRGARNRRAFQTKGQNCGANDWRQEQL